MQLPSNKIGGLIIVVVLIVVLTISGDVIFDKIRSNSPEGEIVNADLLLLRNTTDQSSVDTDGDGLLDWQEEFYGSNPNLADTDGDGTNDGQEVAEGRDPTIPGPNDSLIGVSNFIETEFEVEGYTPGSLTDNVSVSLFSNYMGLKENSALNSETSFQLANQLAEEIDQVTDINNVYSFSDLNFVEANKETLKKYGREFAIIYIDYATQLQQIPMIEEKEYLSAVANKYKDFAKVLAMIEVPNSALSVHLEIVNKINNTGFLISEMTYRDSDPIRSLFAIQNIPINGEGETELYTSLANYFRDNGIIFEDNKVIRFWSLYE